jgi:hypothetical protein
MLYKNLGAPSAASQCNLTKRLHPEPDPHLIIMNGSEESATHKKAHGSGTPSKILI